MPQKKPATRQSFQNKAKVKLDLKPMVKWMRDLITHAAGFEEISTPAKGGSHRLTRVTTYEPGQTLVLEPGPSSPLCQRCGLHKLSRHPYLESIGADCPDITFVVDAVSGREDAAGELGAAGAISFLRRLVKELGFDERRVRWSTLTRCGTSTHGLNYKIKGNWCRWHLVQDILRHQPRVLVPVGTTVLGLLSHKSNAQDWGGRLLTYRGWPDDWLTNPLFAMPQPHPAGEGMSCGHPIFGPAPNLRIPMVPIQAPRLVFATQNQRLVARWRQDVELALKLSRQGVKVPDYNRPWWQLTEDPELISHYLHELSANPGTVVDFDVETTGLRPWAPGARIVFMMLRWDSPGGEPRSIGFPWDFEESRLKPHLARLAPQLLAALYASKIYGFNLSFDLLFATASLEGADLDRLADSYAGDLWHATYTLKQRTGSMSLDTVPYDWVPSLAGYEEEMALLIRLMPELLHPEHGGHYARCPRHLWDTHLKPYVMGDVEVVREAFPKVREKLSQAKTYKIPLAHPSRRGRFRLFEPPSRAWVYDNIITPAGRVLTKLMGRGMFVDQRELAAQEDLFPKLIREARDELRHSSAKIERFCQQMEETVAGWELDLESRTILKNILFEVLELPIDRLTEAGKKRYGENPQDWSGVSRAELIEVAAIDKFTLNALAVAHPEVRPLQRYRSVFKEYTFFVRPMRNLFTTGVDKRERKKDPYLMRDGRIHPSFRVTGTRSGRLSASDPNVQQIKRTGVVKRLYVSSHGNDGCIYEVDASQIELRLIAAACGDKAMVEAYQNNVDLHALTHSKIFNKPYERCTNEYMEWLQAHERESEAKKLKEERKIAKSSNFLTSYGGGPFGLQTTLSGDQIYKSIEWCEDVLEAFFDGYPSLRDFLGYYKDFILRYGVAVSIFGRVRTLDEAFSESLEARSKAQRSGCNHVIQATASDLMMISLRVIENVMRAEKLRSRFISTVHDSLVVDCLKRELPAVHEICVSVLDNLPSVLQSVFGDDYDTSWMIVPFAGSAEAGKNYLDKTVVPNYNPNWNEIMRRLE